MEYRRATAKDIEAFVQNRIEFVTSIREVADIESFEKNTKEYLKKNINSDELIIMIAVNNNDIIASCMACVFKTVPLPSCLSGKTAEILNVYTKAEHRKKGYAKKLLQLAIEEAKKIGVEKIILEYTDEGLNLYKTLGFLISEKQMQLKLK